jgi:hypothetical protein
VRLDLGDLLLLLGRFIFLWYLKRASVHVVEVGGYRRTHVLPAEGLLVCVDFFRTVTIFYWRSEGNRVFARLVNFHLG